jgi:cytoskeletal protein RodZ
MSRTKQGGSVLGFVVIGAVMVLLLIAGVYMARHYWAPASDAVAVNGPTSPQAGDNSNQNKSQSSENKSDSAPQPSVPAQPTTPSTSAPSAPAAPVAPVAPSPSKLPVTGPADTLLATLVLGAIAAAAAGYVQSLRHRTAL